VKIQVLLSSFFWEGLVKILKMPTTNIAIDKDPAFWLDIYIFIVKFAAAPTSS
jgi:hypothetical protein